MADKSDLWIFNDGNFQIDGSGDLMLANDLDMILQIIWRINQHGLHI